MRTGLVLTLWIIGMFSGIVTAAESTALGNTRVATWKNDKAASFGLMFDDSMSIHLKNVVPELKKRDLVGTFYVNPNSNQHKAHKKEWEQDVPAAGMVLANHTFNHKGAVDEENLDSELKLANDAIRGALGDKTPTLISFGVPGGVPWLVPKPAIAEHLKKYNLIERPPVGGKFAQINLKTGRDMIALVDKAIESHKFDFVAFHGVGGEWLSIDLPAFIELIDAIVAKKDKLWVTDTISAHKYQTERETAEAKVDATSEKEIKITLSTKADTKLYDQPLTLITHVPAGWKMCEIVQGTAKSAVKVSDGKAMYEALPNGIQITLQPAKGE